MKLKMTIWCARTWSPVTPAWDFTQTCNPKTWTEQITCLPMETGAPSCACVLRLLLKRSSLTVHVCLVHSLDETKGINMMCTHAVTGDSGLRLHQKTCNPQTWTEQITCLPMETGTPSWACALRLLLKRSSLTLYVCSVQLLAGTFIYSM